MQIFDGNSEAKKLDYEIIAAVPFFTGGLGIVQLGYNEASKKYVDLKIKKCSEFGVKTQSLSIDENVKGDDIVSQISDFFKKQDITGGIIQLPLPNKDLSKVLDLIPLEKDIDILSTRAKERFYSGDFARLSPSIRALNHFLSYANFDPQNKKVVVIGYGELIGRPISYYLSKLESNVTVYDSRAPKEFKNIEYGQNYMQGSKLDADLLILATSVPNLVIPSDINSGCMVVDFGSCIVNGKTVGNLDIKGTLDHLNFFSPSPGGMGPLVVRYLIMNLLKI